jgi:glutathione S-transferase
VRAVVDIAAPPERVFEALTEPRELAAWWSGDGAPSPECDADARAGGAWRVRTVGDDGRERTVDGEYRVVDPPRRLEHSWHATGDAAPSVVRYDLEPREVDGTDGTRLTVTHTVIAAHASATAGATWRDALAALRARLAPSARPLHAPAPRLQPVWCAARPRATSRRAPRPAVAR